MTHSANSPIDLYRPIWVGAVFLDTTVVNGTAKPNHNPTFGMADLRNGGPTPAPVVVLKSAHCAISVKIAFD